MKVDNWDKHWAANLAVRKVAMLVAMLVANFPLSQRLIGDEEGRAREKEGKW